MTESEFEYTLGRSNLTIRDLEGFCKVCYLENGKKSKNPLPTLRAILFSMGMEDVPVHFNRYPLRPGLNVRKDDHEGRVVNVSIDFVEV